MSKTRKDTQTTPEGQEIPVPKRKDVFGLIEKVAGRTGRKRPDEKGVPPKQSE